jgi:hypothetical protein
MVLVGKLSTEVGIKTSGDKFFKLFASEIHELQNICGSVHETKLHEGEEWHHSDSVKHWTHILGKSYIYISNSTNIQPNFLCLTWFYFYLPLSLFAFFFFCKLVICVRNYRD